MKFDVLLKHKDCPECEALAEMGKVHAVERKVLFGTFAIDKGRHTAAVTVS